MTAQASAPPTGRIAPTGTPGAPPLDPATVALGLADAAAVMRRRSATGAELEQAGQTWAWLRFVPGDENRRIVSGIAHGFAPAVVAKATGLGETDVRTRWARAIAAIVTGLLHRGQRS
jgi:hypothetical protein